MKISIASPSTGTQKTFEIDDEKKLVLLHDKRIGQDFAGDVLGDQFKGYLIKITGGQDKDGFPMKQGVLTSCRVRLLLNRGDVGYQAWRGRKGERRRKSVRGCIVAGDISILNCTIIKEGPEKIEGLNDHIIPRKLGPKRASKIRKLFNLSKEDDVRKYVIRRYLPPKEGKDGKVKRGRSKAPKIQRLVTPVVVARWRRRRRLRLEKRHKALRLKREYLNMLTKRKKVAARRKKSLLLRATQKARKEELAKIKKAKRATAKKHEKIRAARAAEAKATKKKQAKKASGTGKKVAKKKAAKAAPAKPASADAKKKQKKDTPAAAPAVAAKPTAKAVKPASKPKAAPAKPAPKGGAAAPAKPKPQAKADKKAASPAKPAAPAAPKKQAAKPEGKKPSGAKPEAKKAKK